MLRLATILGLVLLVPGITTADTLVTWTSNGTLTLSELDEQPIDGLLPPVGTPYQITISFDQAAVTPHFSGGSNCFVVPVSGSLTIGGASYGLSGRGMTHATLPLTCEPGWQETAFFMSMSSPVDNTWPAISKFRPFFEAWYTDLLNPDGFPVTPTSLGMGFQLFEPTRTLLVQGRGDLQGALAEQPAPVPEPGTMALVGLGLAAAIRRARKLRSA